MQCTHVHTPKAYMCDATMENTKVCRTPRGPEGQRKTEELYLHLHTCTIDFHACKARVMGVLICLGFLSLVQDYMQQKNSVS